MDNDLTRSVRMLEDAIASPNRSLLRKSMSKPKQKKAVDLTLTMSPYEMEVLMPDCTNTTYEKTIDQTLGLFLNRNDTIGK